MDELGVEPPGVVIALRDAVSWSSVDDDDRGGRSTSTKVFDMDSNVETSKEKTYVL